MDDEHDLRPVIERVLNQARQRRAAARESEQRLQIYREEVRGALARAPEPMPAPTPTHAPSASASPAARPEAVAAPAEAVPVAPKGVRRREMVKRHIARWPTIETDMKDAGKNGLAAAAKAGERGWREAAALEWAREKSRLLSAPEPGTLDAVMGGGFPSRRHTLAR